MSLASVRSYFRTNLEALNYKEWRDYINFENIPGTIVDQSYHLETVSIAGDTADQQVYTFQMTINVRLFRRSYNDTVATHELLITAIEGVHAKILNVVNRTSGNLFDLIPGVATIEPLGDTTDNWQMAVIPYTAVVKLAFT